MVKLCLSEGSEQLESIEVKDNQDIKTTDKSSSEVEIQLTQSDVGECSFEPLSDEIVNAPKQTESNDNNKLGRNLGVFGYD